ncbi:MAG: glycosyltransferase, partial [Acidobacteriota bacterium]|nr:glycosyltransferase [Acidobacteriota bacterium]
MPAPVVITGGGTGGHVFAMQAIADALRARGVAPEDLRYVGSRRGQESALLAGDPVALTLLPGRGLRRSMGARDLARNAGATLALALAAARAWWLVARWRPSVVVSVGGYAALPTALAALAWRRPLVLVDLDAMPSAVHRLLGSRAAARCAAFEEGAGAVVTGAPVRAAVRAVSREDRDRRA